MLTAIKAGEGLRTSGTRQYHDEMEKDATLLARADAVSRENALNGKYLAGNFGLGVDIGGSDRIQESPDRIRRRADLADKLIADAEVAGMDTTNKTVLLDLGEQVRSMMGEPISRTEAKAISVGVALQIIGYYAVAFGIWGPALGKNFLWFSIAGGIAGLALGLLTGAIIAVKQTREGVRDIIAGAGYVLVPLAILIGGLGIVIWFARVVLF